MDDLWLPPAQRPIDAPKRPDVMPWRNRSDEVVDVHCAFFLERKEAGHIAFPAREAAVDQPRVKAARTQLASEVDRLDSRPADVRR